MYGKKNAKNKQNKSWLNLCEEKGAKPQVLQCKGLKIKHLHNIQ